MTGPDDTIEAGGEPGARARDLWPFLRPFRAQLAVAVGLGTLGALAAVVQPLLVAGLVDGLGDGVAVGTVLLLVGSLVVSAVLGLTQQLIVERAGERLVFAVRERVIAHLLRLPIASVDRRSRGDLVSRTTTDTGAIREALGQGVVEVPGQVLTVLAALVMMGVLDPVLLLLVLGIGVLLVLSVVVIGRRARPAAYELQAHVGVLAAQMERALGGLRTIRAARSTEHEVDRGVRVAQRALGAGLRMAGLRAVVGGFVGIATQVVLLVVVGVGSLRAASGWLSPGELSAFVMYAMMVVAPSAMLAGTVSSFNEVLGAFARIQSVLALPQESRAHLLPDEAGPVRVDGEVVFEFRDVDFGYEGEAGVLPVLHGVSFRVPQRGVTAFVGPSGAGKSTVLALMEQFYDPSAGEIRFFGVDVATMSRDAVRASLTYVEQDAVVLAGTVRDNLGPSREDVTDRQRRDVLRACNLLPEQETGRSFLEQDVGENGALLSGGERQRLSLARAMLSGAEVLLLDEATSHLDSVNESRLQDAILRASRERTVVLVAHRLSTVVHADQIVVLDEGRVVAVGDHETLLDTCSLYHHMARLQEVGPPAGPADRWRAAPAEARGPLVRPAAPTGSRERR